MLHFNVLYTRDATKKRKRWCDGEFQLNTGCKEITCLAQLEQNINVTTFNVRILDKDSGGNAFIFNGSMSKLSVFSLLIEGDEVKCGSILVQCHDLEPRNPTSDVAQAKSSLNVTVNNAPMNSAVKFVRNSSIGGNIINNSSCRSRGAAYKPFKVPSCVHDTPLYSVPKSGVPSMPSSQQPKRVLNENETVTTNNGVVSSSVVQRTMVRSNTNSLDDTHSRSIPESVPNIVYLLDLPRFYLMNSCNANKRSIELPLSFANEMHYAHTFIGSLCEEFRINVADLMAQLESKMMACVQDADINTNTSSFSSSAVRGSGTVSQIKPTGTFHSRYSGSISRGTGTGIGNKQVNQLRMCGQMQRIGVPLFAEADIIISGGKGDYNSNGYGYGSSSGHSAWGSKTRIPNKYPINKRRKYEEDIDEEGQEEDEEVEEHYKMFLKVPEAVIGSGGGSSVGSGGGTNKARFDFSKGDIWVLWRGGDSDMFDAHITPNPTNTNTTTSDASVLHTKLREDYLNAAGVGYNFPWFRGCLMKKVWLVRSLWHSFSKDTAMTEVSNLNGNHTTVNRNMSHHKSPGTCAVTAEDTLCSTFPPHILSELVRDMYQQHTSQQTRKSTTTSGTMKHYKHMMQKGRFKFYALRLSNELCSLMPIDVLGCPHALSQLQPGNIHNNSYSSKTGGAVTLWQEAYYNSRVCKHMLMNSECRPGSATGMSSRPFPRLAHALVCDVYRLVLVEFRLNLDQVCVLQQVAGWFLAQGEMVADTDSGDTDVVNNDIILVHGVFGSGKSHLIAAICVLLSTLFHVYNTNSSDASHNGNCANASTKPRRVGLKCMISSNTNVAVDRILTQLAFPPEHEQNLDTGLSWPGLVRIGNVFKVNRVLRKHLILQYDSKQNAHNELMKVLRMEQGQAVNGAGDKEIEELKHLVACTGKETSSQYSDRQKRMLETAEVIGITCASAGLYIQQQMQSPRPSDSNASTSFNTPNSGCFLPCHVLILDEASQMLEPVSLLPIIAASPMKLIVVGDPLQLPPTLATPQTGSDSSITTNIPKDLSRTLFDRLSASQIESHSTPNNNDANGINNGNSKLCSDNEFSKIMLRTQYRCHPRIANICSELFYHNNLINGVNECDRESIIGSNEASVPPVCCYHNALPEMRRGDSYVNPGEAGLVFSLVCDVFEAIRNSHGVKVGVDVPLSFPTIGVICMYKAQAFAINKLFAEQLTNSKTNYDPLQYIQTSTVDAFQGCEKDIIFICTSRNADTPFISNPNRLNVAISRAKSHLFVIGNLNVLGNNPLWKRVIEASTVAKSNRLAGVEESRSNVAHLLHPSYQHCELQPTTTVDIQQPLPSLSMPICSMPVHTDGAAGHPSLTPCSPSP